MGARLIPLPGGITGRRRRGTAKDRRHMLEACVGVADALMELRKLNPDRFEIIVRTILDSVPDSSQRRALFRQLMGGLHGGGRPSR